MGRMFHVEHCWHTFRSAGGSIALRSSKGRIPKPRRRPNTQANIAVNAIQDLSNRTPSEKAVDIRDVTAASRPGASQGHGSGYSGDSHSKQANDSCHQPSRHGGIVG